MTVRYCSKEWLEECGRLYSTTDSLENALKKVTTKLYFRITADPTWGIEEDILFGAELKAGKLLDLGYYSEEDAQKEADFILATSPQIWKGLLRRDNKFITEFITGKINLEQGSKVELLKITPYANYMVDVMTQVEIQYQDEMTSEEVEDFRADLAQFREETGV
jgi:putative sterol carrier protein